MPSAKANGSSAVLHCDYDIENGELYSVKFYHENEEFYRFLPKVNTRVDEDGMVAGATTGTALKKDLH